MFFKGRLSNDDSVKNIIFGENIKRIGRNAIYGHLVENVIFLGKTPPICFDLFHNWDLTRWDMPFHFAYFDDVRERNHYVPKESLEKYNKAFYRYDKDIYTNEEPSLEHDCDKIIVDYTVGETTDEEGDFTVVYTKDGKVKTKYDDLRCIKTVQIKNEDEQIVGIELYILKPYIVTTLGASKLNKKIYGF